MSEQSIGTVVVTESGHVGSETGRYRGKDVHTGDVAEDQYGQKWRVAVASGLLGESGKELIIPLSD